MVILARLKILITGSDDQTKNLKTFHKNKFTYAAIAGEL
jgi:hypothetical protein